MEATTFQLVTTADAVVTRADGTVVSDDDISEEQDQS